MCSLLDARVDANRRRATTSDACLACCDSTNDDDDDDDDDMSPAARDVTNEDAGRSPTGATSAKSTLSRYVGTPLRSAGKVASALVGGFFFAAPETEEKDARAAGEAAQARAASRGRGLETDGAVRRLAVGDENGGGRTRMGVEAMDIGAERARPTTTTAMAVQTSTLGTDSPTPFTEIKEFLRRGQMDRERLTRPVMASAVKPVSPFERAPAFEAQVTPVRERAATTAATTPNAGSPGYSSMRRSYVASGTPSLLGARGRTTVPKPAILEPPVETAALTPTRMSLKREREVTFLDLERERARNTTPRRLESSAGPGAEARAPEYGSPAYQTPIAKTVTSAVTTDTAKRILQTLDRLASTRTATPMGGSTAGRTPGFAARPAPQVQAPSPIGSAFENEASAAKLTPTSATFVQTPKSGVSFAASPMPFVSSSASGRAPPTPYPTSAGEEHEEEIEARVFDFGTDEIRYSKGHKAPAGPVASVSVDFQFGTDDKKGMPTPGPEKTKLLFTKPTSAKAPVPSFTAPPPVVTKKVEEAQAQAPKADKPVMNLWSADFLAKNQEHQKKVQAAIEEEENAGAAAPAKPSPFAPAPAAGDKPAFSFGIPAAGASSGAAFSFGSTAPVPAPSTGAAPFSFGVTAPAKPAEPAKPAGESGLLAFLGGSSQEKKASDAPASAPTFTFGAPPKSPENVPVKAPEPAPAFTFGGSTVTSETTKPASGGFTFGGAASTAATTSTTPAAPISFGAKPVEKAPELSTSKSELSASAPAFTFGAKAEAPAASTPATTAPFTFGGAKAGDAAPKPAAFTFGATATKADDAKESNEAAKPAAAGFSFGGASAPAFGTSTGAASDNKPESAPAFKFGASAPASSGAASGGFSFGASAPAAASSGGFVFGASSDAAKPASANPFGGGLSVNTKSTPSVFGNASKADEQPNTPEPMSPFETSKSPTVAGASLFGSAATSAFPASSAPSANPFGGSSSFGASAGANPFGGPSSTPAFGAPAAPASGVANPFGSTSAAAPAFGGVAANPFGASTAPAPVANPFGANPAPSGGFSMGGGDAAAGQGGRKPTKKFKRPPKRN